MKQAAGKPQQAAGRRQQAAGRARRAVATLVVLLLISITLALSYSIMRSQSTAVQIQHNANLTAAARRAAVTGVTMGLKKMHTADWGGVDTTLTGSLGAYEGFEVTFTTGDPALAAGGADYADYPYRVTLLSTGHAADPSEPSRLSAHQARAVVRLIPRKLADEPPDWSEIVAHTVFQYTGGQFDVNVPFRIEGPVRIQRCLELAKPFSLPPWYMWSNGARLRYLTDLELMRQAGGGDFRPFTGPLSLPYYEQTAGLINLLNTLMDIPTTDVPPRGAVNWNHPGPLTSYQIYPGGKVYSAQLLGPELRDVVLAPDVQTNPLGIYYRPGELRLHDNVRIKGTLVTRYSIDGNLCIYGKNVHLEPHDLPALAGDDVPVQLPVAVLGDGLRIFAGAGASIAGLLAMWDDFELKEDLQQAPVELAVEPAEADQRLDAFLSGHLTDYTLEQLRRMTLAGCVLVDGQPAQGGALLQAGQRVTVFPRIMLSRIVARDIKICGRSEWFQSLEWWNDRYNAFLEQEKEDTGTPLFPVWLQKTHGLNPQPQFQVRPDPMKRRYHWKNLYDPVYVPHPDDASELDPHNPGLRWDLLEWTDNP